MSKFREISESTMTIDGTVTNKKLVYSDLGGNSSKPVYFGLKDGDKNWTGNLASLPTQFNLYSNVSGCTATTTFIRDNSDNLNISSEDIKTIREIYLTIPATSESRTITFSYNGMTVLTVKQNVILKGILLICVPKWTIDPDSIKSENSIGFSTHDTATINDTVFVTYSVSLLQHMLCGVAQDSTHVIPDWKGLQLNEMPLKVLSGNNLLTNYQNFFVAEMIVTVGGTIMNHFEGVTSAGRIYIFVKTNQGPKNVGYVEMKENWYNGAMLAELG